MKRLRVLLVVLTVVMGGLVSRANAAICAAACEPGAPPDQAAVQGFGGWDPAVTVMLANHEWYMLLDAECRQGSGAEVGAYEFVLEGTSNESCEVGSGSGTIEGDGPHGDISGNLTFYKVAIHYYMTGTFWSGGHQHKLNLWVDVIPDSGQDQEACPYEDADVFGHGAIDNV